MGKKSRKEYFQQIYRRYREADGKEKGRILDEFCRVCGYNRKYAIAKLNGPAPEERRIRKRARRGYQYSAGLIAILSALWVATGYLCAVRLKAAIPLWLPWIREHFRISAETESGLLRMSARQMDRRLQSRKRKTRRAIYGRTKPGTLLKHQIPIKTDHWDVSNPGYSEIDLVSHSGHSAAGEFAYSLNLTDIFTAWVETRAVLGKSERVVVSALEQMRQSLPYTLRGIDSDNGSEFINEHLLGYCRSNGIQFTRGRPYKKDDNAHIEQKNWTHVRKLFGWRRYDTSEIVRLMNDLYENDLRCFMNMFMPSMKLKKKIRVGSRIRKIYDAPKTPLDRLLESGAADPDRMAALVKLRNTLNPFELSRSIETKIERIQKLVEKRSNSNRIVKQNKPGRQDNSDLFTKRFTKPGGQ